MTRAGEPNVMRRAAAILDTLVLGLMAVAMSVSIAAIVYQGPLSAFVARGVALTLIGGIVMGAVGTGLFSWRGAICSPQSTLAVVIALFAGTVAAAGPADERAFATVSAYVAATTLAMGGAAWLLGRLRVGMLAGYFPLPVVLGFLAATGYLLVMGGLGMAIGHQVTARNLPLLFGSPAVVRWLPWAVAAVAIVALTRRLRRQIAVPLGLVLAGAGFYLALWALGLGLEDARRDGLLIGPFPRGFLGSFSGWRPLELDPWALLGGLPNLLTVVGLGVVGTVLALSSMEVAAQARIDVDSDLRAVGIANLAAGLGGGSVGYHSLALTLLATGLGMKGPANGVIVVGASALALAVGAPVIGAMPVGVFAAGIMVIGITMLVGPLVDQRRAMPAGDYLVVLLIPLVTAAFGFLWGVAVGLLTAALLFVVAIARVDVLRLATTAARLRSRIERPAAESARLSVLGQRAAIYGLEGYLFFGTAHRLARRIEEGLDRTPPLAHVVIDFGRVRGLDTSAARALARLEDACRARGVALRLAGLGRQAGVLVRRQMPDTRLVPALDQALEEVEGELLAADGAVSDDATDLVGELRARHPSADLDTYFRSVSVPAGAEVIAQGAASDSLLVLQSGALTVEVMVEGSAPVMVAHCRPGAVVGEIGLYAGVPRTARVVSEAPSSFLRIDSEALARMARDDPGLLADFHRLNAATLARRLGRTTALLADAEILGR